MISKLELRLLKELYKRYEKTKMRQLWRATDAFSFLEISGDLSPIHNSPFISIEQEGTHECFQITAEGIRYMDNLPNWWQRIVEPIKKHGIQILIIVVGTVLAAYLIAKFGLEGAVDKSIEEASIATTTLSGTTTFPGVWWSEDLSTWVHS